MFHVSCFILLYITSGLLPIPMLFSILYPFIPGGISSGLIITNQTNEDKVNLTATAECVYPYNTTVRVQYREEQVNYFCHRKTHTWVLN